MKTENIKLETSKWTKINIDTTTYHLTIQNISSVDVEYAWLDDDTQPKYNSGHVLSYKDLISVNRKDLFSGTLWMCCKRRNGIVAVTITEIPAL